MLRPGFEPGIVALRGNTQIPSFDEFQEYLESTLKLEKATVRNRMVYARKYYRLLETWNLSELLKLSNEKRGHIMRSLSLLSKYQGKYEKWQQARNNYQLKWSSLDSLQSFHNITDESTGIDKMIDWVKASIEQYPRFTNILIFNTLTGLRPTEAVESFNLLLTLSANNYLSQDCRRLEHFRFPTTFLRRTKKAFISIVNQQILNLLKDHQNEELNYSKIRLTFQRNNMECKMSYCRKIFATFLRNEGIESEIIDMLQGRIPNSIFVRHYYRPNIDKFNEIREKLDKLSDIIVRK
jgi:intergrase/recombinase